MTAMDRMLEAFSGQLVTVIFQQDGAFFSGFLRDFKSAHYVWGFRLRRIVDDA